MVKRIDSKSALNKLNSKYLPYNWDLNIFRGCSHHCQYCYAQYSHRYLEDGDFFGEIYVKDNIPELLEKKISSKRWKGEIINLGGVTDSYQILEKEEKIMPEILRILIKYKNPVTISTKSKLILRDIDLWDELSNVTSVSLAVSLTTFDSNIYPKTEPGASKPAERLEVLKEFRKTNVNLGVLAMPFLPFLTDTDENLDDLFSHISSVPVDYVLCQILNLRGVTKNHFLGFIKREFPEYFKEYLELYKGGFVSREYREVFYNRVSKYKRKYNIQSNYEIKNRESGQLTMGNF